MHPLGGQLNSFYHQILRKKTPVHVVHHGTTRIQAGGWKDLAHRGNNHNTVLKIALSQSMEMPYMQGFFNLSDKLDCCQLCYMMLFATVTLEVPTAPLPLSVADSAIQSTPIPLPTAQSPHPPHQLLLTLSKIMC